MSYLGFTECFQCHRQVDVSLNRAGMAYYRCAPCGVFVQQKNERGNRMMMEKVHREDGNLAHIPDTSREAPKTAAQEPRESREITEHQTAPEKPAKAVKRGGGLGFWGG